MNHRKLVLRREQLTELSYAEMTGVVGGASGHASCECPSNSNLCVTGPAICSRALTLCV